MDWTTGEIVRAVIDVLCAMAVATTVAMVWAPYLERWISRISWRPVAWMLALRLRLQRNPEARDEPDLPVG